MKDQSVVVFGAGRFGTAVAQELFKNNMEVMIIDQSSEKIQAISTSVTTAVRMDITDTLAIEELGLSNFDIAVIAIGSDLEASIIATVAAKEHGIKTIYSKAVSEMQGRILKKVGADQVIYPEKEIGERLARSISGNNILEYIHFSDKHSIAEVNAPKCWENRSLEEINIRDRRNIMIIAIYRGADTIISPTGKEVIIKNDKLIIIGENKELEYILDHA